MRSTLRVRYFLLILSLSTSFLLHCSTPEQSTKEVHITPDDQVPALESELLSHLTSTYGAWEDELMRTIARSVASQLRSGNPDLNIFHDLQFKWLKTNVVPIAAGGLENAIIFSKRLWDELEYENEMAFVVAFAWMQLKEATTRRSLDQIQGQSISNQILFLPGQPDFPQQSPLASAWFSRGGLYDIGIDKYLHLDKLALTAIYAAHYDPRGAVGVLTRWQAGQIYPSQSERLNAIRLEIARLSPNRDAIINTRYFEEYTARKKAANARK